MQAKSVLVIVLLVSLALAVIGLVLGIICGKNARRLLPGWIFPVIYLVAVGVVYFVGKRASVNIGPILVWEMLLQTSEFLLAFFAGYGFGIKPPQAVQSQVHTFSRLALLLVLIAAASGDVIILRLGNAVSQLGILQSKKYEPQKNKDCPENLKSIYNAINLYSQDWDALPPFEKWLDNEELTSKIRQNEWLHCPEVSNRHDEKYGYAFNDKVSALKLGGKHLNELPDAVKTPLLYDSRDISKSAHDSFSSLPRPGRHGGRNNVLYLDGHVEAVNP